MSWEDRDYASGDPTRRADGFGGLNRGTGGRFVDNPLNWSPTLGHLFGIRIRIHAILIFVMAFRFIRMPGVETLIFEAIFFFSILFHEFGHCFAARSVGGSADDILMWPLGGLASVDAPRRPGAQFITVICGPLVNVAICIVCAIGIVVLGGSFASIDIYPFYKIDFPTSVMSSTAGYYAFATLYWAFMGNMFLFVFNLLPMYPMDGGRMLQCLLWGPAKMGYHKATLTTCTVGMVLAVLTGLFALWAGEWILIGIAVLGYMACFQERKMVQASAAVEPGYMGYDFSGGYSTLDKASGTPRQPGFFAKWKQKKQQGRWKAERERAAAEQLKVDAILDKVKTQGIASLTNKEKKLLEDATRRQNEMDRRHGV